MPPHKTKEKRVRIRRPPGWAESLNHAILESALDCIICIDGRGNILEFNPAAERIFGFTRDEVIGRELAELIIPARFRDQHRRGLANFLKTGQGIFLGKRVEINALRRDGSEILVELAITPYRIDSKPFFTAYLRDITKRKRDEEAQRHLAAIVHSSQDAILSTDLNGDIRSWNQGAQRLYGYTPEEVIGKSIAILIPPERHNEEQVVLDQIRLGERVERYESVRRRKDGTHVNVSMTRSPIKDEDGHVVGASKIARDITARVRIERRRSAQYAIANLLAGSHSLAEAGPHIIEIIAGSGNWIFGSIWLWNESEKILRCEVTWHTGAPWLEKFQSVTRTTPLLNSIGLPGRVFSSKRPFWISDVSKDSNFPRKDFAAEAGICGGFGFPLLAEDSMKGVLELFSPAVVEPDDDLLQLAQALGSQIGLFIQRRQTEAELQRQKEAAETANAAKDRFLATLSHELRTPLTPVLIWAGGTVDQPGLTPEMREGLKMVCRNVELEARLIDDLLDLTRLSRGKLQLQLRQADAHDLVRQAIEIVASDIHAKHLNLVVKLDAKDHTLRVDSSRLQQVFWNVLRNACKFTPESGVISIRSHNPTPGSIAIEISDSGIGISAENLEKIFDAFEQIDSRREGLGLGLAISKVIIEMHRGAIRAKSEGLGKGATFAIELPTATSQ